MATRFSVLSGTPSLTTSAQTNTGVGNYAIVAAQGSLSAANYSFSFTNGTLGITRRACSTADNKSRVYGQTIPLFTVAYSGF